MRIWQRLAVGLAVIIALLAANGYSAVRVMDGTSAGVRTMMDEDYAAVLAVEHMVTSLFDMNLQESYFLAYGDAAYLDAYNASKADYLAWGGRADAAARSPEEVALLTGIDGSFSAYDALHRQVVVLYEAGDRVGADNLSMGASNDEFYRTYHDLLSVEDLNTRSLDASYSEVKSAMAGGVALQRFVASVSLAIAVVFGVVISGTVGSSVRALSKGVDRLRRGEVGAEVSVQTGDELGELAASFNAMSARLREREGELRSANAQLTEANERLERLDSMRSLLLGNVSHELRTPLASIKGHVEAVLDDELGPVSDAQRESLGFADRDADHLDLLIEDLLLVSTIESGGLHLHMGKVDLRECIDWSLGRLADELGRKGMEAMVDAPPDLPPLRADRDRVVQVLTNVIQNATKFSPAATRVTITASIVGRFVEGRVTDQGAGVPPDALERIFDKFHQVDPSATRRAGGAGLGLFICKGIVEAHGGRIWAENAPGGGTTIAFQLPAWEEVKA